MKMAFRSIFKKLKSTKLQLNFSTSPIHPKNTTLSQIKRETNPENILQIIQTSNLSPENHRDRISYTLAISKLKNSHHFDSIRRIVNDSLTRPDLSERSISHFIVLYGKAGLVKDAVKLFDEMSKLGIERNVKTMNALLFSCHLGGDYAEMKRVYEEFPGKYGLVRELETYNVFLRGACGFGDVGYVKSVVKEMERNGVECDVTTFGILMGLFYANGKYEEVEKLVGLMKERGVVARIGFYNDVILNLCKVRKSVEAKGLLDRIVGKGMKPDSKTYKHLIHGFCVEGKLDVAKGLFVDMEGWGLRPEGECYFTLVHYLCEGKEFEAALGICKKCIDKGWFPNFSSMLALVNGLASVGKVEEARGVISEVKEFFPDKADKWHKIEEDLPEFSQL